MIFVGTIVSGCGGGGDFYDGVGEIDIPENIDIPDEIPDIDSIWTISVVDESGHTHSLFLDCDTIRSGAGGMFTTSITIVDGELSDDHQHTVTITSDQMAEIRDGDAVTIVVSDSHGHRWPIRSEPTRCD